MRCDVACVCALMWVAATDTNLADFNLADENAEDEDDGEGGGYLTVNPNEGQQEVPNVQAPDHQYGIADQDKGASALDDSDGMALYDMPDGPDRPASPDE